MLSNFDTKAIKWMMGKVQNSYFSYLFCDRLIQKMLGSKVQTREINEAS